MRDDIIRRLRAEDDSQDKPSPEELVRSHVIPQGIEVPKPESIFELSGIPVFTKKSISTLIGKAKSGKTTATAWMVAQCLNGGLTVLWIDTEQGEYYGSRTQYWVLSIAGMDTCPNLTYMDLKTLKPPDRTNIIEEAIKMYTPDMVVVDGIRDLVFDINDPEEATIVVGNMMRWAEEYDIHVLSILHQNKGNEHARGHLGAEMTNKSETVIKVDMDDDRNVVCQPEFTRSEPFQPFAFARDSYGMPVLIDGYVGTVEVATGQRSVKPTDYTIEEHKEYLKVAFRGSEYLNRGDFESAIIASFGLHGVSIGEKKARAFVGHYVLLELVKAEKNGKFVNYYLIDNQ